MALGKNDFTKGTAVGVNVARAAHQFYDKPKREQQNNRSNKLIDHHKSVPLTVVPFGLRGLEHGAGNRSSCSSSSGIAGGGGCLVAPPGSLAAGCGDLDSSAAGCGDSSSKTHDSQLGNLESSAQSRFCSSISLVTADSSANGSNSRRSGNGSSTGKSRGVGSSGSSLQRIGLKKVVLQPSRAASFDSLLAASKYAKLHAFTPEEIHNAKARKCGDCSAVFGVDGVTHLFAIGKSKAEKDPHRRNDDF